MSATSQTFVEVLRARALEIPNQRAFLFLADGEREETQLDYRSLDLRARAIAAELQARGAVGGRVLLLYPSGLDFVAAFFACLYAGATPVPAHPPDPSRRQYILPRLRAVARDAQPTLVMTLAALLPGLRTLADEAALGGVDLLASDSIADLRAADWQEPAIEADTVALLQYTSGSTAAPKGVVVSHRNLLHNQKMMQEIFEQRSDSVVIGWLPMHHDMGLIGNVLHPVFLGASCVLMSPLAFLRRPARWLQAITRYHGTVSGGPNFGFDICCRRLTDEQLAGLDLRCWEAAFNGAEPIRPEVLRRFAARLSPAGFRWERFCPCYGLAEATLVVTGKRPGASPHILELDAPVVGVGSPTAGEQLLIVNPDTRVVCAAGEIGEIWLNGPSVARGYFNRPDETAECFGAHLANGEGPFLRTGDHGLMQDGELFVTGRIKDLIICAGRNHYPQDIELTVEACDPRVLPGGAAAFGVSIDGTERLAVLVEIGQIASDEVSGLKQAIHRAIVATQELQPHVIQLVRPHSLPKTSSGKLQRRACRDAYLAGALALWP